MLCEVETSESFEKLLAAARNGEEWAATELYRSQNPGLLRYLRATEPREAEDLASEVWVAVAANLSDFTGDEPSFRAWLFMIARRRLIDLRRSAHRRRSSSTAPGEIPDRAAIEEPETDILNSEATRAILEAIARLPDRQAEVVRLRVLGGLSAAEVAEVLGKPPGTIRVLQHRALRQLAREVSRKAVTK